MKKIFKRYLLGLMPAFLLIFLTSSLDPATVNFLWQWTLAITFLFYLFCALIPRPIRQLQSMPYTYNLPNNWGQKGLEAQLLTYASYHTHWYNHITHAAFPFEAFLWQSVFYLFLQDHFSPLLAFIFFMAATIFLILQAISFKEMFFTRILIVWWLVIAFLVLFLSTIIPHSLFYSATIILLLSLGFWRFTGHWVEPVPPAIINNPQFVPIRQAGLHWKLLAPLLLGFFSEFAAGLPFRLVNAWIYVGLQQRFPQKSFQFPWYKAKETRVMIHQHGWNAHERTKTLIAGEPY